MKLRNRSVIAVLTMALAFAATQDASAQLDLLPFKKSKAKAQTLQLQQNSGPWLISCYSFSGENGLQQAQRLANELRQDYKLKAYTYTHRFDINQKVQQNAVVTKEYVLDQDGKEVIGADGRPMLVDKKLTSASGSVIVETAVLVGDFTSVEDEKAQALLAQIKRFAPKSLEGADLSALAGADDLAGGQLRRYREGVNRKHETQGNTLRNAFMLPNPASRPSAAEQKSTPAKSNRRWTISNGISETKKASKANWLNVLTKRTCLPRRFAPKASKLMNFMIAKRATFASAALTG